VLGISQDDESATGVVVERLSISFPVLIDNDLRVSRAYDPVAAPTLFLLDQMR
jgi:peroxiredoxin